MKMRKLDKAYKAVAILESLSLPVNQELKNGIALLEKDFLRQKVIPLLKDKMDLMLTGVKCPLSMRINLFSGKEVSVSL